MPANSRWDLIQALRVKLKIHTPRTEFINKGKYYIISRSQIQLYNNTSSYFRPISFSRRLKRGA